MIAINQNGYVVVIRVVMYLFTMETTSGHSSRHSKYFFVVLPYFVFQGWLYIRFLENYESVYFPRQMPIFCGDGYEYLSWWMRKSSSWCYK